jgi:pyridoxamine 5'-phosphate oxidase
VSASEFRREYDRAGLDEGDLDPDPVVQFLGWFDAAIAAGLVEPNAMTLATATADGQPSARMVLLKGVDARGFVFYTNYESRKGRELEANPHAALVLWWGELQRQVRVEGRVERASREESAAYFRSRPAGARLGAWTSEQSRVIDGRAVLDARLAELTERFADEDVPLPPFWGGYRVVPEAIEFWQGRQDRLHDRLRYRRQPEGGWSVERLAP